MNFNSSNAFDYYMSEGLDKRDFLTDILGKKLKTTFTEEEVVDICYNLDCASDSYMIANNEANGINMDNHETPKFSYSEYINQGLDFMHQKAMNLEGKFSNDMLSELHKDYSPF